MTQKKPRRSRQSSDVRRLPAGDELARNYEAWKKIETRLAKDPSQGTLAIAKYLEDLKDARMVRGVIMQQIVKGLMENSADTVMRWAIVNCWVNGCEPSKDLQLELFKILGARLVS